ncbi:MAG: TetR/AcrR family transcriptional regulator [Spirochaeta sp.]
MPRIVDHDAWRHEIALRAIPVFRTHGYSGIGMRRLAQEIGVSKSALYHYFPTKQDLFLACSKQVGEIQLRTDVPPVEAIMELATELENIFHGELRLLVDYLDQMQHPAADDHALAQVNQQYLDAFSHAVGAEKAHQVLIVIYGYLLKRLLDAPGTSRNDLRTLLNLILQ